MSKRLPFKTSIGATAIVLIVLYSISMTLATIITDGLLTLTVLLQILTP